MSDGPQMPEEFANFSLANESPHASFEQQFVHERKTYKSLGGSIDAVFAKPESPKSHVPVIIAPGWSVTTKVLKDSAGQLYSSGRSVIALDHPRRGGEVIPQDQYPAEELRKALTIQEIIKQEDLDKVDIVAHSEGAINAAIAASLDPEKIRNMVFFNPSGLIGKDTLLSMLGRFSVKNIRNVADNLRDKDALSRAAKGQAAGASYFLQNPVRAVREIRAISQSEIDEMLRGLHDQGIGIVVIHGVDDPGYPMKKVQKIVKSASNPGGFVDGFLSVKGGHDELYIHPEKYMNAAEEMLTALEKRQSS